jgi:hypothetical protein
LEKKVEDKSVSPIWKWPNMSGNVWKCLEMSGNIKEKEKKK